MASPYFASRIVLLIAGVGLASLSACNKQPNTPGNGAVAEAPPLAALPLAAAAVAPAPTAPLATALPAPSHPISYAPAPPNQRYRYIDDAYSMGDAFADTPPDYAVDYQGTRPWIWRARNGAYRIVEQLPRGERIYYYGPGQDQPFLVRDPDYSYAYDGGRLVGVYGPDGADLAAAMAARRADDASRYYERSRELYRAAQYENRQAAYASEWASRRDDLISDHRMWQQEQARNSDWRSWHEAHQPQESSLWSQERNQRLAYASAIGIPVSSSGPQPSPDELARRQATYFASRNAGPRQAPTPAAPASTSTPATVAQEHARSTAPIVTGPPASSQPKLQSAGAAAQAQETAGAAKQKEAAAAQAKATQAAQAQQVAAEQKKKEEAAAQASAAQAALARKAAEQARQSEAAAARTKAAQAAASQKAAADAQQKEAAAARAKAAKEAQTQKAAADAQQKEAAAARARAAQAAQAQKVAADAKEKEVAAAEAKAAQAAQARRAADDAQRKEAAAAQAKTAQLAAAEKAQAEARQHEAAAAQAKAEHATQARKATAAPPSKPAPPPSKEKPGDSKGKHEGKKQNDQQQ